MNWKIPQPSDLKSRRAQDAQNQFDERRATTVLHHPGRDGSSNPCRMVLPQVELLQQPNNLNAIVAERAVQTAIRRVSSSISAAQNAVRQREAIQPFASDAEKQAYFESFARTGAKHSKGCT